MKEENLTPNDYVYMFVYPAHGKFSRINYLNGYNIAIQDPRETFKEFQYRTKKENDDIARIYLLALYAKAYEKYINLVDKKIKEDSRKAKEAFNYLIIVDNIKTFKEFIGNNCVL
jgi:hypothetical protein